MTISLRFAKRTLLKTLIAGCLSWLPTLPEIAPVAACAQETSSTGQNLPPNPIDQADKDGTALHISLAQPDRRCSARPTQGAATAASHEPQEHGAANQRPGPKRN